MTVPTDPRKKNAVAFLPFSREMRLFVSGWFSTAQQQIGGAGTPVMGLRRGSREDLPPQLRLLQPARNRTLEDAQLVLAETSPGDDEHATPSGVARRGDEARECPMRLGLGHSVKI